MDVKGLARSLGVTQLSAISKATELLRLLKLKVPGSLGQGEICRPAVCLELACQITPGSKLPIRDEFIRYSCTAPKVYNEMFTRIQRLLDVRPALDLRELVTLFGCSQLHDSTQQLLRIYKSRFLESLSDAERVRTDLSRPALLAAAFLLTAKKHRTRVDRGALLVKMGLTRAELTTALEDFCARCEDQLASAASRKRGRDEGGNGQAGDGDNVSPLPWPSTSGDGLQRGARGVAKRRQRAKVYKAEDDEDGAVAANNNPAVAVDDFKLVLIGLGSAAVPPAAEDPDGSKGGAGSRKTRPRRKALACAAKGNEAGMHVADSLQGTMHADSD